MDGVARTACAALAACLLAGCGADRGTLHANTTNKLSIGIPVDVGQYLTLDQTAVDFTDGHGLVVESVTPLGLRGSAVYLGAAILKPPRVGFGNDLSDHFPHLYSNPPFVRLPYATRTERGSLAVALGFTFRRAGVTTFAGVTVRYRRRGVEFVAVLPLGAQMCVPAKRWFGRCAGPTVEAIPEAAVRRA